MPLPGERGPTILAVFPYGEQISIPGKSALLPRADAPDLRREGFARRRLSEAVMRLVIVQDYLRIGGTERQSLYLADYAHGQGHDVSLLLFRPGGRLSERIRNAPYPVECLQGWDTGLPLYAPGLLRRVRQLDPDAVLCMGRTANCYAGFIQRALPRAAVIGTLRTGKTIFPLHAWSLRVVRAVLVNSNWWKRRMLERGFPPDRIQVVHNSVLLKHSEDACNRLRMELREREAIGEGACVFLCVASFRSGKRHLDLLRLFSEVRRRAPDLDARLWLVGDGPERKRCQDWAAENGIGTRVRFWGYQNNPLAHYAAGDVAVSASREDSLPNFLIESQAAGLPVVAYDFRGVSECCASGVSGSVVPMGDADAFVSEMIELGRKEERWKAMRSAAPGFARRNFSPLQQAETQLAFIRRLLEAAEP